MPDLGVGDGAWDGGSALAVCAIEHGCGAETIRVVVAHDGTAVRSAAEREDRHRQNLSTISTTDVRTDVGWG